MRIPRLKLGDVVLYLGLSLVFASYGCGKRGNENQKEEFTSVMENSEASQAHADGDWHQLAYGIAVCRATGSGDTWIVDYPWFWIESGPKRLFNRAQMESLDVGGYLDSTTTVNVVTYRTVRHIHGLDDLQSVPEEFARSEPPENLLKAFKAHLKGQ